VFWAPPPSCNTPAAPCECVVAPCRSASARTLQARGKADLTIDDLDLVEHNEAYSTASIVVQRELSIPDSKFNVNGAAIAMGHPIGASGARIVATMIYALKRRGLHTGMVTLCLGGGEAVSMILQV
jgi:acetyl-CoA C-acetyltransferase